MIREFISRWTMVKTPRVGFYDRVAGKMVYYWQDCYFEQYMASSRWGFRIKLY